MPIPAKPKREVEQFIAGADQSDDSQEKTVITLRIEKAMVKRLDSRAKELGISRTAFMLMASVKALESGL